MPQASFAKRRANPRFTFFAEAEVTLHDGTSVLGQISELSSRGCYIDMLQPIPIGTELRLRISDGTSSCELPSKVIYMHSGGGLGIFGIGVLFGEMTVDQYTPHSTCGCANSRAGALSEDKKQAGHIAR